MPTRKLTKPQLKDEQVLAAIIAGGVSSGRKVMPALRRGCASDNGFGVRLGDEPQGPCCAVGAGVLYGGYTEVHCPRTVFADVHGVSIYYASGVSDGFEDIGLYEHTLRDKGDGALRDYERGLAVGQAVYDYFHGSEAA